MTINMRFVWALVFTLVALLEGVGLGRREVGDTLSEAVWFVRFDAVGVYFLLPLWAWLTWHWILKPDVAQPFGWRDVVAVALGLAWAVWVPRR